MKNSKIIIIISISFLFGSLISCNPFQVSNELTIEQLKGADNESYLNDTVIVEAIFIADPIPMLITTLDIVLVNTPMPDDQYIVLLGDLTQEMDPTELGGAKLRVTGVLKPLRDNENDMGEMVAFELVTYDFIERLRPYYPAIVELGEVIGVPFPKKYAILFSGGYNSDNNHTRYWNDLKFMYNTLLNNGYSKHNMAILYADGVAKDNKMPVHYKGTEQDLQTVFTLLKKNSTEEDTIFFFTTNHGGGFHKQGYTHNGQTHYIAGGQVDGNSDEPSTDMIKESNYNLDLNGDGFKTGTVSWDEDLTAWGGSIQDDIFSNLLNNLKYARLIILMEQCFSGGLIADMGGTNRVIISAATEYEFSEAMPPLYNYDEFSYHFTSALNGATPSGQKVNADTNNDKRVSMVEAFNYARDKDTRSETPMYEDSGDGIPHSGKMPAQGEGNLGAATFL